MPVQPPSVNGYEPVLTITTGANLLAQQLAFIVYPLSLVAALIVRHFI